MRNGSKSRPQNRSTTAGQRSFLFNAWGYAARSVEEHVACKPPDRAPHQLATPSFSNPHPDNMARGLLIHPPHNMRPAPTRQAPPHNTGHPATHGPPDSAPLAYHVQSQHAQAHHASHTQQQQHLNNQRGDSDAPKLITHRHNTMAEGQSRKTQARQRERRNKLQTLRSLA